jgi:hypothetical protein
VLLGVQGSHTIPDKSVLYLVSAGTVVALPGTGKMSRVCLRKVASLVLTQAQS